MKKIWVRKFKSFREAEEFDIRYYRAMPKKERLETMQFLREIYYKFKAPFKKYESREGLRRVIRIIQ